MNSPPFQQTVLIQTVFIVDDDAAVRKSLQLLIEMVGLNVRTFPSAANFLDAYEPGSAGCLILDLKMPGMNGLDLQQELIRRHCALPIIVLTGYGDIPSAIGALKGGAVEFLEKPVDDDVLLEHVRHALALDAHRRREHSERDLVRERMELLTPRERQVLDLVVEGLSSKEIGQRLHVSCKTVEMHRSRIMKKMKTQSVANLVRIVVGVEAKSSGTSTIDS